MDGWKDSLKSNAGLTKTFLLGGIVIIIAVAASIGIGWWERSGRYVSEWVWWSILAILLVGISTVVLAGTKRIRESLARYREQRFLAQLQAQDKPGPEEGAEEEQRKLREKMQEAIRTLQRSPDLRQRGGIPLYAVPWYLLIGASQSGKTTLLRAVASSFAPFERPSSSADAPTQNCDWWFFNTAIVLDTAGSYAVPIKGERDSTQWFRFLQLLRYYRELQPINGLIMAVGADTLASRRAEDIRLEAVELRKRIDEAIRELGVDFPIYLLITRCDLIEGFTEFFGCLPEHVQRQVFGHVNETRPRADDQQPQTPTQRLESVYAEIVERLQQLRLSIFNAEKLPPAMLRQKIFCFPEEFRALLQPLSVFVEALVGENPFQHRPFFRGLFFSSAQQQGTPHSFLRRQLHFDASPKILAAGTKPHFLHDLFAVILQRDQYLVRPTRRAIRRRLLKRFSIVGGCVALCLLLLFLLTWTFFRDQEILASVNQDLCREAGGGQGVGALLEQAEGCRQVVRGLIEQNRQRFSWSKFVFNRSGRLEGDLRQRYVEKFETEVLASLDAGISRYLTAGSETISLVIALIKRIELINRCLSVFGCPYPIDEDMQPDYSLMLNPGLPRPPSPAQATTLRHTYEAYLHWASGSGAALRREQAAHADQLRVWFSSKQFAPREILLWASQNYAPVSAQRYWEGLPPADGKTALQVDGAYTPAAWKQSILPFLQRAGDAVPDMEPLLKDFQEQYRAQYFEQWRRFLTEFPRGEAPSKTREQRRRLAVKLLDEQSPYHRIIDVAFEHLTPFLPAVSATDLAPSDVSEAKPTPQTGNLLQKVWRTVSQLWVNGGSQEQPVTTIITLDLTTPAWARVLGRYVKSESRKTYLETLKQIREQLAGDAPLERSYRLAQAAFNEGGPTDKSTHPVLKTWWIIGQIREQESSGAEAEEKAFWPLLERPVLVAWKVILEGTGEFLQKSWAENVVAPTRGLSRLEQANVLYGPQGKVREFVSQFLSPFLVENESRSGRIFGEEVPLAPQILAAVQEAKQVGPILELKAAHRVRVDATRASVIDSQTNLLEEKTEFLLECETKGFKANNRPQDPADASTTVFWSFESCGDVTIAVYVSCGRSCVDRAAAVGISVPEASSLRFLKRYSGQTGFLRFIQDFRGGSQVFGANDFTDTEEVLRRYRINTVRVFYRLDVPDNLWKLIAVALK